MAPSFIGSHTLDVRDVLSAGRFPSRGWEVFSILVHLLGIAVLSGMLSRKLVWILKSPTWPRILVLMNHASAWGFFFTISILVDCVGLEVSHGVCYAAITICTTFYVLSKITIYLFLAEKVYAVWSVDFLGGGRLHCKAYLLSLAFLCGYAGIVIMLYIERVGHFRRDGLCVIGERRTPAIIHLSYDTFVNVFLTMLFVWPILSHSLTLKLRTVAVRSLWASAFALSGSITNISFLAILNGRELGWICLSGCSGDMIINAATMYWVTARNCDLSR